MNKLARRFLLALSFLTVLPLPRFLSQKESEKYEDIGTDLSKASIFFPLIGLLIGIILFVAATLLEKTGLPLYLETGLILILWVALSGGLHLEGLADMVDGFSGGQNREEILHIMKDGSIGAKGAISLILFILFKYLLLFGLVEAGNIGVLLLSPMVGRWAMVITGYLGKPASPANSLTRMFTSYLGKKELLIATIFTAAFGLFTIPFWPTNSFFLLILFFIIISVTLGIIAYSNRKIGGICGDVIGAINEISELAILLVIFLNIK